jgi:DNA-binding GntR family transcriptional regulator
VEKARSQSGEAYRALRSAIVAGDLAPGLRLSPAELSARFGLGPTPIREALARLAAENLATAIEQRGYRVAPLSSAELRELLTLRLGFEREAMFRSMSEGGPAWEAELVAAFHLLSRSEAPHPGIAPDALEIWSRRHDAFHIAIIAGCDAPWLRRFHAMAVEQIERYRIAILRQRALPEWEMRLQRLLSHEDHAALRESVLSRDEARADAALSAHISETADTFAAMFENVEKAYSSAR